MDSVERFLAAINHKEPDRVPIHDSPWLATADRWHREGLPADQTPAEYFGFEMVQIRPDISPRFPTELVEQNAEYLVERTSYGRLQRQHRDRSTTPEILDWSVKCRADWDRIKPRLLPDASRVDWASTREAYEQARRAGRFVVYDAHVGYAQMQEYIKTDDLLLLLVTEPEWVTDMFATQADLVIGNADILRENGILFDAARISCDLGYRNATLFSPATYRKLQFPHDRRVFRHFRDQGLPVILHSDGRVKALIPQFLEAGVSALNPIEAKAGMDLVELKREYGRDLCFFGGIDVRAMSDPNPAVIESEIRRKFEVAMVDGGFIYHSDHSVPNDVSFEQYRRVMDLVRRHGRYQSIR
jgi:uroporphyrinogen decarboxylase